MDTIGDQEEDDDLDLTNLYSLTQQPTITDDLVAGAFEEKMMFLVKLLKA